MEQTAELLKKSLQDPRGFWPNRPAVTLYEGYGLITTYDVPRLGISFRRLKFLKEPPFKEASKNPCAVMSKLWEMQIRKEVFPLTVKEKDWFRTQESHTLTTVMIGLLMTLVLAAFLMKLCLR